MFALFGLAVAQTFRSESSVTIASAGLVLPAHPTSALLLPFRSANMQISRPQHERACIRGQHCAVCNSNVRQSRKHAGSGMGEASTPRRLPGVILPADSDPQDGTRT